MTRADLPKLGRMGTLTLTGMVLALLVLAWFQGGEEPLRPIVEDVAMPGAAG